MNPEGDKKGKTFPINSNFTLNRNEIKLKRW